MINNTNSQPYNLEERTYQFAEQCRDFTQQLPKTTANYEYGKQLIRSSGSQAANYIEANESLGKKDFAHRIKICRKETKESCLWLRLCIVGDNAKLRLLQRRLIQETIELRKIFSAILEKT